MKLKAKCNIIYGGKLYRCGDEFEAEKALAHTETVEERAAAPKPEAETIKQADTPKRAAGSRKSSK